MIDEEEIEISIRHLLTEGLGLQLTDPHLKDTPRRVARAYREICSGYEESPYKYNTTFPNPSNDKEIILLKDITAYSLCSHHLLPFKMQITVAYIPQDKIIGISKIERITKKVCQKLQVQENIGNEIIQCLNKILSPYGVVVLIKDSEHYCMTMRGTKSNKASLTTIKRDGLFKEEKYYNDFLKMIK